MQTASPEEINQPNNTCNYTLSHGHNATSIANEINIHPKPEIFLSKLFIDTTRLCVLMCHKTVNQLNNRTIKYTSII